MEEMLLKKLLHTVQYTKNQSLRYLELLLLKEWFYLYYIVT